MSKLYEAASRMNERLDLVLRRPAVVVPTLLLLLVAVPLQAGEAEVPVTAAGSEIVASGDSEGEGCIESDTVMCLRDGRYEATLEWMTPDGEVGQAKVARPRTRDSGLFFFFNYNNWEVLLKVLDGCTFNKRHWVYAASASDLGMTLVVRDTTLPNQDADGTMLVNSKTYHFAPHSRRPQMPDESGEEYRENVLAKGHPALTDSAAFPNACES